MSDAKICPRCEGEFQSWVTECPDCEIPLISPAELAERQRALLRQQGAAALQELEDDAVEMRSPRLAANEGTLYRAGDQNLCVGIAHALSAQGVAWRIAPVYGVFVLPEDIPAADEALHASATEGIPDLQPTTGDHDDACPACGFKLRPNETECPECGLALG